MSPTTLEMPKVLSARINRGLTPATSQEWVVQEEDPGTVLTRNLGQWLKDVSFNEDLFKKHVYENENLSDSDLRQHRARICGMIADGDELVKAVMLLAEETRTQNEAKPIVSVVDQRIKKLFDALIAWHAPLAAQTDIPESFKQAAREVEEEKIVNLDI